MEQKQETIKNKRQIKDSLIRAFDQLHSGKVRHNARNMFRKYSLMPLPLAISQRIGDARVITYNLQEKFDDN